MNTDTTLELYWYFLGSKMVESEGIEPSFHPCHGCVLAVIRRPHIGGKYTTVAIRFHAFAKDRLVRNATIG